jgi:hypothetical protein
MIAPNGNCRIGSGVKLCDLSANQLGHFRMILNYEKIMKAKKLADYCGYWDDYNNFGNGINHGEINFDGDKLKSTREIFEGKDCIVSRITDKKGNTRISQIEYPLIYAEDEKSKI